MCTLVRTVKKSIAEARQDGWGRPLVEMTCEQKQKSESQGLEEEGSDKGNHRTKSPEQKPA
jgi:hypothetical protein